MENEKQWWQSKTMVAGIVTLVIGLLGTFGLADLEGQQGVIVEKIMEIVTAAGSLVVLWGRITATSKIVKKPPSGHPFILLILLLILAAGCTRPVWMEPGARLQFNAFNASVQDWDRRCSADPNTCAESLNLMAAELSVWTSLVNGIDPNEVTP